MAPEWLRPSVIKAGAKAALSEAIFQLISEGLEEQLKEWTPDRVKKTVGENADLFADLHIEDYQDEVRQYAQIAKGISSDMVLEWIRRVRPDLAKAVDNEPGGREWFSKQAEALRKRLFG